MEEEYGCFDRSLQILLAGLCYCKFNEGLLTKAVKQYERNLDFQAARNLLSSLKDESFDSVWRSVLEGIVEYTAQFRLLFPFNNIGALFEVRAGKINSARVLFEFLTNNIVWYGPIYFEAYRLEERENNFVETLTIISKGLNALPRYGPLWFGLLRIMERFDVENEEKLWQFGNIPQLNNLRGEIPNSIRFISHELVWKIYFEQSQAEENAANITANGIANIAIYRNIYDERNRLYHDVRISLVRSLLACPMNLKWKVWLAGSRLELSTGLVSRARQLLGLALATVPIKSKAYVYLEASRVEEFCGNIASARNLLLLARNEIPSEWKIYLEAILLETRCGNMLVAVELAEQSLQQHSGTGRLWAVLMQLCHRLETIVSKQLFFDSKIECDSIIKVRVTSNANQNNSTSENANGAKSLFTTLPDLASGLSIDTSDISLQSPPTSQQPSLLFSSEIKMQQNKFDVFEKAIHHVPKSGEVWCEGARCVLNPINVSTFDLTLTQRYLQYAIQFTPQYGDAFIEYIRFEMIAQVLLPVLLHQLYLPIQLFITQFVSIDNESDLVRMVSNPDRLTSWLKILKIDRFTHTNSESDIAHDDLSDVVKHQRRRAKLESFDKLEIDLMPYSDMLVAFQQITLSNLSRR